MKRAKSMWIRLVALVISTSVFAADVDDMQRDDAQNPGFLNVNQGEILFKQKCASCHDTMQGIAAKTINLEAKIRHHTPLTDAETLNLSAFIALQSRGLPFETALKSEKGEAFFKLRQGQLNLSCANCHDDNAGRKLGDAIIPGGYTHGYPQYRLEWQAMGNLTRRIKNCLFGMRAIYPADEMFTELEIYMRGRGKGLIWESPAVRP